MEEKGRLWSIVGVKERVLLDLVALPLTLSCLLPVDFDGVTKVFRLVADDVAEVEVALAVVEGRGGVLGGGLFSE